MSAFVTDRPALDKPRTDRPGTEKPQLPAGAAEPPLPPLRDSNATGELDLFAFLLLQRRHLARTLLLAGLGLLLMLGVALRTRPRYFSSAVLIVPRQSPSPASLIQQASGLDLLGGGYEVFTDIMRSRTIAMRLIEQYHLVDHYRVKSPGAAWAILLARSGMDSFKEGMIRVTVADEDSHMAANLANSYLIELDHLNQEMGITAAAQRRVYFEKQMVTEKNALADAEVDLKRTQEQTGVLMPGPQALGDISAVEGTRAQLRGRQVQLDAVLQGATEENPEVKRLRAEIAGLEGQLHAMESGAGGIATGTPATQAPSVALIYTRKLREVKFHEGLLEMLSRSYEAARQQEAKDISGIEILDNAVPAEAPNWPPKLLWILAGCVAGAVLGVVYTILESFAALVLRNPENQARVAALKSPSASGPAR